MYPAAQRTKNLLHYFGWQGGTIHQLAQETGLDVDTLLYADRPAAIHLTSKYSQGACANETCSLAMRLSFLPEVKGNRDFWLGVCFSKPILDH